MKARLAGVFLTGVSVAWLYPLYEIATKSKTVGVEPNPYILIGEIILFITLAVYGLIVAWRK